MKSNAHQLSGPIYNEQYLACEHCCCYLEALVHGLIHTQGNCWKLHSISQQVWEATYILESPFHPEISNNSWLWEKIIQLVALGAKVHQDLTDNIILGFEAMIVNQPISNVCKQSANSDIVNQLNICSSNNHILKNKYWQHYVNM